MDGSREELDIVIVGAGVCGLATALALHRKGIRSVVLERSETLRATGAGIRILTNGWRALDELGVGSKLRAETSVSLTGMRDINLDSGKQRQGPVSVGEARCVRRSDVIKALADSLPPLTLRFGCGIISVKLDTLSSLPILHLSDGSSIRAKVLIGCDGANSVVAEFLDLKPKKVFNLFSIRGFTNYPNGHGFTKEFIRMKRGSVLHGRAPVDEKLVYWFVLQKSHPKDSKVSQDPELIKQLSLEALKGYPKDRIEMINNCDLTSLYLTHLRYRAPWDVLLGRFRRGAVTVAGDAMHVMGPFIGQGGSAAIEDAVVLARCLAPALLKVNQEKLGEEKMVEQVGGALDKYVKERRMRLVWLSAQTFIVGSLLETSSMLVKVLVIVTLVVFFSNPIYHTSYDCGSL